MAAEASRSSGSVDSYIGSLISLTSKSEIRYEGVLFTINTQEASIGLRNVQSFGTEGRKKDGPQIPSSSRVYEYIVFRGSDIKDLQVKSSPPVHTESVQDDPAIIQSDRSQAPSTTSLPPANSAPASAVTTQIPQNGPARSPFQTNLPLYQPGANASWGSTAPSSAGLSRPIMPLYQQQGFYGSSSSLQSQQPSLLQPPQGLPMAYPVQQPISNSSLNASVSQTSDFQPMLLQPPVNGGSNALPGTVLGNSMAVAPDTSTGLLSMSQNVGLPLVPPVSNALTREASYTMTNQTNFAQSPMTSYGIGMPEPVSAASGASNAPSLVTPGHFAQPGLAPFSDAQPSQTMRKDVEAVQVSSSVQMPPAGLPASASSAAPVPASTESAPLLPLPSPAIPEFDRAPLRNQYSSYRGGGRGRGRGSELSNAETKFTEEFDFEAMNEKFNKDEVWGQLGKNRANEEEDYGYDYHNDQFPPVEPVYNKDDFFDTLSSNTIGNGSRGGYGRPRFSEQRRLDTETFGEYSRYRGGRGWRGRFNRGGHYGRGGYGYGYGYDGRGRGHQNVYRV